MGRGNLPVQGNHTGNPKATVSGLYHSSPPGGKTNVSPGDCHVPRLPRNDIFFTFFDGSLPVCGRYVGGGGTPPPYGDGYIRNKGRVKTLPYGYLFFWAHHDMDNCPLSIVNCQLSTINYPLSTLFRFPSLPGWFHSMRSWLVPGTGRRRRRRFPSSCAWPAGPGRCPPWGR